jgi:serine/threonine protein kinase/Tol biopolymer transport system component
MAIESGGRVSHYRLVEKIGEGGMGVVWKAEDTKLSRQVALKALPAAVAADPARLERFKREATAIAALNHPNIVTIYSIEEQEGEHFLTMELIQGKLLSESIPANGMSLSKFFALAVPLAEAISAAHQQGITHRDLKPDNIMIGVDGRVKVLDFGLAKLSEAEASDATASAIPTRMKTEEGTILGTVAYMAPEQAEGKGADARSDIFSLGIVLYEMATGDRPFKGDSGASIISSILRDTPPNISDLNKRLPRHLGRIIRRCLAKDPMRRYQVALEVRNELEDLKREVDTGETVPAGAAISSAAGSRRPSPALLGLLGIAVAAVVVAALMWRSGDRAAPPAAETSVRGSFTQITAESGREEYPSLSPDGKTIAYASRRSGNWDIYVQRVGGRNPINLTTGVAADDWQPAFSPDGESLVFRSERDGGGIFLMGATGESVRRLTHVGCDPAWSPDGKEIVYATECFTSPLGRMSTSELWIVQVAGGESRRVYAGDAVQARFSPDGGRLAFWGLPEGTGEREIWTLDLAGGDPILVTEQGPVDWNPVWSPDGGYLYFSSDRGGNMNLWRIPIDQATGETLGQPQPVTTGVSAWSQHVTLSKDGGRIVYASSLDSSNVQRVSFDPATGTVTGEPEWITRSSGIRENCSPAADEEWLACSTCCKQEDIIMLRVDGSERRQLTEDSYKDRYPRWFPDRDEIVFYSDRGGSYDIWTIHPDGSGLRQLTDTPGQSTIWPVLSPDGSRLLQQNLRTNEAYIVDLTQSPDERRPEGIEMGSPDRWLGPWSWSPDGRILAGTLLDPAGRIEGVGTYDLTSGEYKELSLQGSFPSWLDDSRRLIYGEGSEIKMMDTVTGKSRVILSVAPDEVLNNSLKISTDNRTIYFTRSVTESDIWMITLD